MKKKLVYIKSILEDNMNTFGAKLRNHFQTYYENKNYIQYLFSPQPYSSPVLTINWYIPSFIENKYLTAEISQTLNQERYPGRVILGVMDSYLLDHPKFSAIISIEINPSRLNLQLYERLITDFERLTNDYEHIFELKKPFSVNKKNI